MDQPTEADRRVVEQILVPEILNALDRHAANDGTDDLVLNIAGNVPSAPIGSDKVRRDWAADLALKISEISLIYVEQRIAIRAGYAFRFVRCLQLERPAAIRAAHPGGRTRVVLRAATGFASPRPISSSVTCSRQTPTADPCCNRSSQKRCFCPRGRRIRTARPASACTVSHRRPRPHVPVPFSCTISGVAIRDLGNRLPELQSRERRQARSLRQRLIERHIKTSLRLGEPADPAVRERRVPLVPSNRQVRDASCARPVNSNRCP